MFLLTDTCTDPAWNLAAEEYLLTGRNEPFVRLWRNSDSVIIGRNQNAWAEIDADYVERESIPVIRRLTGGGAVFHDLGNVNYSFFDLKGIRFTDVMAAALKELGLDVRSEGRNDLTLGGMKISGTAACERGDRRLEHGTLLFDASLDRLAAALRPRPEKFEGKGVRSVRKRVANLAEHLPAGMSVEGFMTFLAGYITDALGCEAYELTREDRAAIEAINLQRYRLRQWNFGASPACSFQMVRKFPAGLVEAHFEVEKGCIHKLQVFGDYFFNRPTAEFCALLEGCPYAHKEIADRMENMAVGEYFLGITPEEMVSLLYSSRS